MMHNMMMVMIMILQHISQSRCESSPYPPGGDTMVESLLLWYIIIHIELVASCELPSMDITSIILHVTIETIITCPYQIKCLSVHANFLKAKLGPWQGSGGTSQHQLLMIGM